MMVTIITTFIAGVNPSRGNVRAAATMNRLSAIQKKNRAPSVKYTPMWKMSNSRQKNDSARVEIAARGDRSWAPSTKTLKISWLLAIASQIVCNAPGHRPSGASPRSSPIRIEVCVGFASSQVHGFSPPACSFEIPDQK
ncbi:hypothetical protein BST63_07795 [Bradyrhizobium canariense]|uniref:Uncharacterized protein n=1 Tax=Bradyrhizobium canariense TaxID=255045 RepID=A0ABX3X972_9BRAD|nr:hypothetical protein BSR47_29660 [Bradyrhizobium canariense]OSJ32487.1 hypothetical protein BST63_07795 [Bradyrhizobium canariense]